MKNKDRSAKSIIKRHTFSPVNGEPFILEKSVLQKADLSPKVLFMIDFAPLYGK